MNLSLGKAIRIIREAKGISLGSLANQAELSVPYMSLLESDKRNPSIDVIHRLSNALDIPSETFILICTSKRSDLNSNNESANRVIEILKKFDRLEIELSNAFKSAES